MFEPRHINLYISVNFQLLKIQEALNSFLLESTKVMFDEMEDIDSLITNIMAFTKDLVSADRCSLFLVDEDR